MKTYFRSIFTVLFFLYFAGLVVISVIPLTGGAENLNHKHFSWARLDYLLHVVTFLLWWPLAVAAFPESVRRKFPVILLTGLATACLLELVQIFTPWRTFNYYDMLSNLGGLVAGFIVVEIVRRVFGPQTGEH